MFICLVGLGIWIYSNILFVFRPLEAILLVSFLPVLISVFIFYIFLPFFNLIKKGAAINISLFYVTLLLILFAAYLIIQVIGPALINEMARFINQIPYIINRIIDNIDHSSFEELFGPLLDSLDINQISNLAAQFITGATNSLTSLVAIVSLIQRLFCSRFRCYWFYMFKDGHKVPDLLVSKAPKNFALLFCSCVKIFIKLLQHILAESYLSVCMLASSAI